MLSPDPSALRLFSDASQMVIGCYCIETVIAGGIIFRTGNKHVSWALANKAVAGVKYIISINNVVELLGMLAGAWLLAGLAVGGTAGVHAGGALGALTFAGGQRGLCGVHAAIPRP